MCVVPACSLSSLTRSFSWLNACGGGGRHDDDDAMRPTPLLVISIEKSELSTDEIPEKPSRKSLESLLKVPCQKRQVPPTPAINISALKMAYCREISVLISRINFDGPRQQASLMYQY